MSQSIETDVQSQDLIATLEDLQQVHNHYTELYNFSPNAYFTLESTGIITQTNPVGASLLGLKGEHCLNKNFARYVAPDSQHLFSEFLNRSNSEEGMQRCELKLLKKDGPLHEVQLESTALLHARTQKKQILVMITASNPLQKADEANGHTNYTSELAAILAQELNHPHAILSNYIQGTISLLEQGKPDAGKILHAMQRSVQQLQRAGEIILRMKNYTCKGMLDYETIEIQSLIEQTLPLIEDEIQDYPVIVRYTPNRQPIPVRADKIHIQQVILNLARNSIDAMRDNCTFNPQITIEVNPLKNALIEVAVLDNGPGLPPEAIKRLFYSHHTTKPYSIGLGLAISRAIIQSHGGELTLDTDTLNGCCFKFTLPVEFGGDNKLVV